MRKRLFVMVLVISLVAGAALFADDHQAEPERPLFVDQLLALLQEEGWSASEVRALLAEADRLDWDGTEAADPEVVALALQLGQQEDLEPGEQALLALDLALTAVEMQELGYDDRAVARATLRGVRDIIEQRPIAQTENADGRSFGLLVREEILARLGIDDRSELRERAKKRALRDERIPSGRPDGPDDFGPPSPTP